jgi:phosphatidylglycerol:prolipoprotein diacylglycerol transferase
VLHLVNGQISAREALSLPVHPTQIYHALHGLILFLILIRLRKYKTADGLLFWKLALFYSIGRFILEFYRGDVIRGFIGVLSVPQFFSLILGGISCYFLYRALGQKKPLFAFSEGSDLQGRERATP